MGGIEPEYTGYGFCKWKIIEINYNKKKNIVDKEREG